MTRYLRTSDIAKAVSVHPNTVRLYEKWGFLLQGMGIGRTRP